MLVDSVGMIPTRTGAADLPLDVGAALEFLVLQYAGAQDTIQARIVGNPHLTREIMRYTPVKDSPDLLIAVSLEPDALWDILTEERPDNVLTLVRGPLARVVRRLRSGGIDLVGDLPRRAWTSAGYEKRAVTGFHGLGAVSWAAVERVALALRRRDLADRARFTMQRCAMSSPAGSLISTVLVHDYRRVR